MKKSVDYDFSDFEDGEKDVYKNDDGYYGEFISSDINGIDNIQFELANSTQDNTFLKTCRNSVQVSKLKKTKAFTAILIDSPNCFYHSTGKTFNCG